MTFVPLLWAVTGGYDLVVGQSRNPDEAPRLGTIVNLPWQTWAVVSLVVTLVIVVEVIFRHFSKTVFVEKLIKEGEELLPLLVQQGRDVPLDQADDWRYRVLNRLNRVSDGLADEWGTYAENTPPQHGFTGVAEGNRVDLWNQVSAGLDWLRAFKARN